MTRLTFPKLACPALFLLLACRPSGSDSPSPQSDNGANGISRDIALAEAAGQMARQDPSGAMTRCATLLDPSLKTDCVLSTVPHLARKDSAAAEAACATLPEPDECFFRLAETLKDAERCGHAGAFEDNCRLHVLSFGLREWITEEQLFEDIERDAPEKIRASGLSEEDPRPWTAIWRWALSRSTPLDRGACRTLSDETLVPVCLDAGMGLFHDRLSQARDRDTGLCNGPIPDSLAYLADPELDRALAQRKATDLCDPTARRAPPLADLPGSAR